MMESLLNPRICAIYSLIKCCSFHTTNIFSGSKQTGVAMNKVLGMTKKKKMHYSETPTMTSPNVFSKGSFEGKKSGDSRRATVLNKLFMRNITDQMATGECSTDILGHGIEINRVQVVPDYKVVKVFWIAKGTANDEVVETILQKNAGFLRHELSQLRIMGVVPMIQFVKDKHYARIVELDNRLAVADFGEDYTPLDLSGKLKTELEIFAPLESNIKEQLKKLEDENEETEELPLPPMPQNVLGLNHADILDRVQKQMKKSEALHRQSSTGETEESWVKFKSSQPINEDPVELGSGKSQRAAFREFLQKRQLLQLKARNGDKNYIPDVEYMKEEMRERHLNYLDTLDLTERSEEDYILEEWDDKN